MREKAPRLAALLGVCLALALAASAQAAEAPAVPEGCVTYAVTGGNVYFDPDTGTIRGCDAAVTQADIPARIDGVDVTAISDGAFSGCAALTAVTIPQGVTAIGDETFLNCSALERVTIPQGVTYIGPQAFCNCSALADVTLPDTVTYIGYDAFDDCSALTSLTIPGSVQTIGEYAFRGCSGLTGLTIQEGVATIGQCAFLYCSSLTDVTVPGSVRVIENDTFDYCTELTHVTIRPGVTAIEYGAFYGCTSLADVTIPDTVTFIGDSAFEGCKLGVLAIPGSVTVFGDRALENCGAQWVVFGEGLTELPDGCLSGAGAVKVCVPSTVTAISPTYTDTPDAVTVYAFPDSYAWANIPAGQVYPMTTAPADLMAHPDPRQALTGLSALDQDMLAELLLTNAALAPWYEGLEQALGGPAEIAMTPDCSLNGQQVAAIGGRLCAEDPERSQAALTFGPASAQAPDMPGQHPYSRLFSISPEGLTAPLRVPILLNLEVPGGLDAQNLSVFCLRSDGTAQPLAFTCQDGLARLCVREPGDYYIAQDGYDAFLTQTGPRTVSVRAHALSAVSFLWAAYDDQGQMLQCGLVPLSAEEGWAERSFDVPGGTARVKGFLLNPETDAPRALPQALIMK